VISGKQTPAYRPKLFKADGDIAYVLLARITYEEEVF